MIDIRDSIVAALEGVCNDVIFGFPCDMISSERLLWRESDRRCFARADGREVLTELFYTLEIYAMSSERACDVLQLADARMQGLGFMRLNAMEQYERGGMLSHITARYRAVVDSRGRIYQ